MHFIDVQRNKRMPIMCMDSEDRMGPILHFHMTNQPFKRIPTYNTPQHAWYP